MQGAKEKTHKGYARLYPFHHNMRLFSCFLCAGAQHGKLSLKGAWSGDVNHLKFGGHHSLEWLKLEYVEC